MSNLCIHQRIGKSPAMAATSSLALLCIARLSAYPSPAYWKGGALLCPFLIYNLSRARREGWALWCILLPPARHQPCNYNHKCLPRSVVAAFVLLDSSGCLQWWKQRPEPITSGLWKRTGTMRHLGKIWSRDKTSWRTSKTLGSLINWRCIGKSKENLLKWLILL